MTRRTKKTTKTQVSPEMSRLEKPTERKLRLKRKRLVRKKTGERKSERKKKIKTKHEPVDLLKIEKEKRLIMWSGITFFMLLILFFWVMNMKNTFQYDGPKNSVDNSSLSEWQDIREELSKTIEEVKIELSELKTEIDQSDQESAASSSPDQQFPVSNDIEKLQEELEKTDNQ